MASSSVVSIRNTRLVGCIRTVLAPVLRYGCSVDEAEHISSGLSVGSGNGCRPAILVSVIGHRYSIGIVPCISSCRAGDCRANDVERRNDRNTLISFATILQHDTSPVLCSVLRIKLDVEGTCDAYMTERRAAIACVIPSVIVVTLIITVAEGLEIGVRIAFFSCYHYPWGFLIIANIICTPVCYYLETVVKVGVSKVVVII